MSLEPRAFLRALFDAAVAAAMPDKIVARHLPQKPKGRTIVIGAGKASAAMAAALEAAWDGPLEGLVVTRDGHAVATRRVEIVEASHPVPDARGEEAARRIAALVSGLTADDLVIALISGGGSALLPAPAGGLTLHHKQEVNRALLKSGADIGEMNCVRKHLSLLKGGRLAALAAPARVHALMISDVPGDDPSVIASGPTVPDATTRADAQAILAKYGIAPPRDVADWLASPDCETPKPGDAAFERVTNIVIAAPQLSLEAAAGIARAHGVTPLLLGDAIEGESREVARVFAAMAKSVRRHAHPAPAPCLLLSGGETTVTVRGKGRGGRNAEFLLALAVALDGEAGVHAIAGDTDGIDGSEDNAGALVTPDTLARAREAGVDPKAALRNNDAYTLFAATQDLVMTGPTLTNVNDFRAVLII